MWCVCLQLGLPPHAVVSLPPYIRRDYQQICEQQQERKRQAVMLPRTSELLDVPPAKVGLTLLYEGVRRQVLLCLMQLCQVPEPYWLAELTITSAMILSTPAILGARMPVHWPGF